MITVERKDYAEQTYTKYGKYKTTIPSHYVCWYYFTPSFETTRKEIAYYDSREDVLRVRTEYIMRDRTISTYQRAITGKYADAYNYLFNMLNVDESSNLSEYMNA